MKYLLLFFFSFIILVDPAQSNNTDQDRPAKYLVLISIDGFRPDFYLDKSWPAPMLQQMATEGSHAKQMKGVFPSITYPSHTTMVTGTRPAEHGILFNSRFGGESYYFEYESIHSKTIWDAASDAGLTTANVGWPVTLHAPFNYNVPISGALQNSGIHEDPIRAFTFPIGFFDELEREATGTIQGDDLSNSNPSKENRVAEIVAYIAKKSAPNVMTVALQHTDSYQHRYGRDHKKVRRAVSAADRAISRIVEAYENLGILEETVFLVGGDHGFSDIHTVLAPNVWLSDAGIQTDINQENWEAVFATSGGSAFLYINNDNPNLYEERVQNVLKSLPHRLRDNFRLLNRDQLDELGANPEAKFALSAVNGVSFTGSSEGASVRPGSGGTHGHLSDFDDMMIGFVAWGAGVKKGVIVPMMDLTDVAPTAAKLIGVDLPEAYGMPIWGILE